MSNTNVHTTFDSDSGKWRNIREGAKRASSVHDTKREAAERGRDIARNSGVEWLGHTKDGRINERDSYGNDPFPPKG